MSDIETAELFEEATESKSPMTNQRNPITTIIDRSKTIVADQKDGKGENRGTFSIDSLLKKKLAAAAAVSVVKKENCDESAVVKELSATSTANSCTPTTSTSTSNLARIQAQARSALLLQTANSGGLLGAEETIMRLRLQQQLHQQQQQTPPTPTPPNLLTQLAQQAQHHWLGMMAAAAARLTAHHQQLLLQQQQATQQRQDSGRQDADGRVAVVLGRQDGGGQQVGSGVPAAADVRRHASVTGALAAHANRHQAATRPSDSAHHSDKSHTSSSTTANQLSVANRNNRVVAVNATHPVVAARRGGRPSNNNMVKKYKCDVCHKAFSRSNTLITHKRIHTGEKPFKCDHCGRAFRQPGNLTRHRLTHTTVKPYICPHCGKAFNRASNLHTHARTHLHTGNGSAVGHSEPSNGDGVAVGVMPNVCVYCGKGFQQRVDLRIHMYMHNESRILRKIVNPAQPQNQGRTSSPRQSPPKNGESSPRVWQNESSGSTFVKVGQRATTPKENRESSNGQSPDKKAMLQVLKETFVDVSDVVLEDALTNCDDNVIETAKYLREMGCKAGDYSHLGSTLTINVDHQQVKYRLQVEFPEIPAEELDKVYDNVKDEVISRERLIKLAFARTIEVSRII